MGTPKNTAGIQKVLALTEKLERHSRSKFQSSSKELSGASLPLALTQLRAPLAAPPPELQIVCAASYMLHLMGSGLGTSSLCVPQSRHSFSLLVSSGDHWY